MLSNGFDKPLHLKRKPSRLLAAYLVCLHALALLALLQPLALSILVTAALWGSLLASAGYHVRYFRRQCDDETTYWVWQASGTWLRGGKEQVYTLVSAKSVNTPWFVIVTLSNLTQQQRLLVLCDQLDADTFRRLRVRLRLHYDEAVASSEDVV